MEPFEEDIIEALDEFKGKLSTLLIKNQNDPSLENFIQEYQLRHNVKLKIELTILELDPK